MPLPFGAYHRIRIYPSGKRVMLAISADGEILEAVPIKPKYERTKTAKRLAIRRRRIR